MSSLKGLRSISRRRLIVNGVTADKFSRKLGRNGNRVKDQAESRHRWAEFEFGRQGSTIVIVTDLPRLEVFGYVQPWAMFATASSGVVSPENAIERSLSPSESLSGPFGLSRPRDYGPLSRR